VTRVTTPDGIGLEVHASGRGDGRAALLLHGLTGNSGVWSAAGPALAPRFRVLALDQRGHGASEASTDPEDHTLDVLARDVFTVLDHFDAEQATLVGHGMGATVAMLAALDRPDRVEALVLVGASAEPLDPASGWMVTRDRAVEAVERAGMEAGWDAYLESGIFGWDVEEMPSEIVEDWRAQFVRTAPAAFVGLARHLASLPDLTPRLAGLQVPTLVVCGDDDQAYAPYQEALVAAIAGAELVWIEGGGHTPQLARGEEFGAEVFAFLRRALPTAPSR